MVKPKAGGMDMNSADTPASPASPASPPVPSTPLADWLSTQPAGLRPDVIAEAGRDASVVGLGVNTRESHELAEFVIRTTYELIERGFTAIAIQDNQRVTDLLDHYIAGGDVDVNHALAQAWGPWQTEEMRRALAGLRRRNHGRGDNRIRIIGLAEPRALPEDYDRALEILTRLDKPAAVRVNEIFAVIRRAHSGGEHVLRAQGEHSGTPFVELARTARGVVAGLAASAARDDALRLLDSVVAFHASALGVGFDRADEERVAAERVLQQLRHSGERVVIWDGGLHIASHTSEMYGAHLRAELGEKYMAVLALVGSGDIGRASIPAPRQGSLEAQLGVAGQGLTAQLRPPMPSAIAEELARPWSFRTVSGVYDPARDHEHYFPLPSLTESFDALAFLPHTTPVRLLL